MLPVSQTDEAQEMRGSAWGYVVDVFSGLGLGLLLGVILALSITPVVSVVVGALAALLGLFLGLEGGGGDDAKASALNKVRLNGLRIGSFGLATVLGLMLGLFVRGNHLFDESLEKHLARWEGFPKGVAQQMVIFERTGLVPATLAFEKGAPPVEVTLDEKTAFRKSSALVGALEDRDLCRELDPEEWNNAPDRILRRYGDLNDPLFADIAARIGSVPDEALRLSMLTVVDKLICAMKGEKSR